MTEHEPELAEKISLKADPVEVVRDRVQEQEERQKRKAELDAIVQRELAEYDGK